MIIITIPTEEMIGQILPPRMMVVDSILMRKCYRNWPNRHSPGACNNNLVDPVESWPPFKPKSCVSCCLVATVMVIVMMVMVMVVAVVVLMILLPPPHPSRQPPLPQWGKVVVVVVAIPVLPVKRTIHPCTGRRRQRRPIPDRSVPPTWNYPRSGRRFPCPSTPGRSQREEG